jgi:hypothetical protein
MPALVAGIHAFFHASARRKTGMAGTSPAMTQSKFGSRDQFCFRPNSLMKRSASTICCMA